MPGGEQAAPTAAKPVIHPYFFLSYARTPKRNPTDRENPDRWVHKLYRDLCDEILQMTDAQPAEAGFMDAENKLGAAWSPELINAIKNCRVFVPLYSRRYFESDNCGREWFAFARREVTHRARSGERVDAIVPALWTRLDRNAIPAVAQTIQYEHAELGERYRADGFYGLMKLQNFRAAYHGAVHRLAQRIIEVGDQSAASSGPDVLGTDAADFASLPSAFGPTSAKRSTGSQLQITVLAHDFSSLPPRRSREYYGATPRSWSPYQPDYPQPVADFALELARKCLDCDPVAESFEAESNGHDVRISPGICLVDAWVALSDAHRERLRRLDEIDVPWLSVLIPWNGDDEGLRSEATVLRSKLEERLEQKLACVPRRCQAAADGIPTIHDLGEVLPVMAMIMLKRYHKNAPAPAIPGPMLPRPRLRSVDPEEPGGPE
ncbi:MAG TPA: TIR-like protein FxsC [Trebonia sp.]|nr:TIR-like protein FxsC [Trebonia sp.]